MRQLILRQLNWQLILISCNQFCHSWVERDKRGLPLCYRHKCWRNQKFVWPFISESSDSSANKPHNGEISLSLLHNLLSLFPCNPLNFISAVSKGTYAWQRCRVNEVYFFTDIEFLLNQERGGLDRRGLSGYERQCIVWSFISSENLFRKSGKWGVEGSILCLLLWTYFDMYHVITM